jgi:thiol reductant ABC exporter CydC subunit
LVRPERRRLAVTVLLSSGTAAAGIGLLATSAWLIARAAQHPSVVALGVAIIGVRVFAVSRGLCRYGERLVGHDSALRVLADLRVKVYKRLEMLAPAGLPGFRRGDLLARLVQDVDTLQDLVTRVIPPYGTVIIVGVPTVAVMWYFLPAAGVATAAGLAVGALLVPWWSLRSARRREHRLASARGELSTHILDLLEGAPELVAFGAVDAQLARVRAADRELTRISASASSTTGVGAALVTLLTGLTVWSILLVAVPAVRSGQLSGPLLAVVALVPLAAFEMVTGLPPATQSLERVRQAGSRVFEVMDAPVAVADPRSPRPLAEGPHHLRLRGLRSRYDDTAPWALDGVDLDLPPGRRVGIVGASGAGKSTLAAVLLRFLPYQEGSVTLDGVELDDLSADDVRSVVGLATPDSHVFDTTLRENLLLARRDASEADVEEALRRARLADWVEQLPGGLQTAVGTHGAAMSGGQQQRLGIARALLAGFGVLILDEPGEHLDPVTAEGLVADVVELTRGRTTVMITHRLAGLEAMDEILVLEAGRVVERGTHDDLVATNGRYAAQWQRECRFPTQRGASP